MRYILLHEVFLNLYLSSVMSEDSVYFHPIENIYLKLLHDSLCV